MFPIVLTLLCPEGPSQPEESVALLHEQLGPLHAQGGRDLRLLCARGGTEAGRMAQSLAQRSAGAITVAPEAALSETELVEQSDGIIVIASLAEAEKLPAVAFARALGRLPLVLDQGAVVAGTAADLLPQPDWMSPLFAAAGLTSTDNLETIKRKMSELAGRAAPITRHWWRWVVWLQGLAVMAPTIWLADRVLGLPLHWVAVMSFGSAALLVGVSWWLRWRGVQTTWARARLVAEVARSKLALAGCPFPVRLRAPQLAPPLRHLEASPLPSSEASGPKWLDHYLAMRVEGQEQYFAREQAAAERERADLSRWATLLLDLALAVGAGALVLFLMPASRNWPRILAGAWLEVLLGLAGAVLPLAVVLLHSLRTLRQLSRRTARYAQQRHFLGQTKARLRHETDSTQIAALVAETEERLISEVIEWYFEAATAEHFFNWSHGGSPTRQPRAVSLGPRRSWQAALASLFGFTSAAAYFTFRVVLVRLLWVTCSSMLAWGWLAYRHPGDSSQQDLLQMRGHLQSPLGEAWRPTPERAEHGALFIIHGLHDSAGPRSWSADLARAVQQSASADAPEICVVDWRASARPAAANGLDARVAAVDFLNDIAGIRPQARQVGDELGIRLALLFKSNQLRRDRPLQLIGHSAGGFIAARAAIILKDLGLAPSLLHVTLLDTPGPDDELLKVLPTDYPGQVEYDITSQFVLIGPGARHPGLHLHWQPSPVKLSMLGDHSYAHEWYIQTIEHPGSGEGFDLGPFAGRK